MAYESSKQPRNCHRSLTSLPSLGSTRISDERKGWRQSSWNQTGDPKTTAGRRREQTASACLMPTCRASACDRTEWLVNPMHNESFPCHYVYIDFNLYVLSDSLAKYYWIWPIHLDRCTNSESVTMILFQLFWMSNNIICFLQHISYPRTCCGHQKLMCP